MSLEKDISWRDKPFDPKPMFYNHMCHWGPWAKHFETSDSPETRMLALMLGAACDGIDEKNRRWNRETRKFTAVFFAFIETVDRIPAWMIWAVVEPKIGIESKSIKSAWKSIQQLNDWRSKNKFNIREWDVS